MIAPGSRAPGDAPGTRAIAQGHGERFRKTGVFERSVRHLARLVDRAGLRPFARRAFETGLWLGTAGRGLKATLPNGEVVRLAPRCRGMRWNPEEYQAFRAATQPGDIVIDAGANAGAYTVLFAQWVGRAGRVYAFEPVPAIADVLRRQLRLNGVADRVTVVPAALGSGTGTVSLVAPGLVGLNRPAYPGESAREAIRVNATSLDEFCAVHRIRPAVVKIDVEGAELDVLRGSRVTIASNPSVRLFVEWHPSLWAHAGIAAGDLQRELAAQGLMAEPLRDGDSVWHVEGICARLRRVS